MYKFAIVLAFCGTIGACAAPQAAPAGTAETAKRAGTAESTTRVCEEFEAESTGTRLGTERVCKTVPADADKDPQSD